MIGIIVAFPNRDNAVVIRNLLVKGGMTVAGVCTSGAQVMNFADALDEGIVICGYKLKDMMYTELREDLPESFRMLLVASREKWDTGLMDGVACLPMPVKAYSLIEMVQTIEADAERLRRKRKEERKIRNSRQQAAVRKAKELLMERSHMSEEEAHRYLQKSSMDSGRTMAETAEMVLSIMRREEVR